MNEKDNALQALLHDAPLATCRRAAHHPPLVVEVAQHHVDTRAFLTERVLYRYLDVLEGDVCSSSCSGVRGLDRLSLNSWTSLDEEHSEAILMEMDQHIFAP